MLEAEADRLCNAERYERTAARRDQRAGSYDRKLPPQMIPNPFVVDPDHVA